MNAGGVRSKLPSARLEAALGSLKLIGAAVDVLPPVKAAVSVAVSIIGFIKVSLSSSQSRVSLEPPIGRIMRLQVMVGTHLEYKSLKRSDL
jgi:hypothetical protein